MSHWIWILIALVMVLALGWYLSYTAARLDRLHARVEGSLSALDAQLIRRAEVAMEIARSQRLDGASALSLEAAAGKALDAAEETLITSDVQERGLSDERCTRESELTHAIRAILETDSAQSLIEGELLRRLIAVNERVSLAHRFHNEAVTDARRVRTRVVVRAAHLAGHTALPHTVKFDD